MIVDLHWTINRKHLNKLNNQFHLKITPPQISNHECQSGTCEWTSAYDSIANNPQHNRQMSEEKSSQLNSMYVYIKMALILSHVQKCASPSFTANKRMKERKKKKRIEPQSHTHTHESHRECRKSLVLLFRLYVHI